MSEQPEFGGWPYILPFLAFMLVSMFEPSFPTLEEDALDTTVETVQAGKAVKAANSTNKEVSEELSNTDIYVLNERRQLANRFFIVYGLKVILTSGLLIYFWRSYLQQFPVSVSSLSVVTGVVGIFVWIGLCSLNLESHVQNLFSGLGGEVASLRSHFNPFAQLPDSWQLVSFLAIRFFGLVVMVPICEELLLRGFLMRYFESPDWWTVLIGRLSFRTMLVAPLYGLLTHPAEALAAVVWFSMVTWLVHRTGKFWDAVVAHAVTNLLLGLYVCIFSQWQLW